MKTNSQLVQSVLKLDDLLSELERVGGRINSMNLKSDEDIEHGQRLFVRFAELGEEVATEVTRLSNELEQARARAEAVAQGVSGRAEVLSTLRALQNDKLEEFRILSEKVAHLSQAIAHLKPLQAQELSVSERTQLTQALSALDAQLDPLIQKAENIRKTAQLSKMKTLTKNADSMAQTLLAVRRKLQLFVPASKDTH